jgi:hypothetical protein
MAMLLRSLGRVLFPAALVVSGSGSLCSQELMIGSVSGGPVNLFTADGAVLESQEARKDLPCSVSPGKPSLGFDLKFHIAYDVSIGLKDLAGEGNQLTMVFRVIPENRFDDPVYFVQRVTVPPIEEDEHGPAYLQGGFDVGEGKYHIDWLMRDRAERVCSYHWDAEAVLPPRDKQMSLDISPSAVHPFESEPFKQEPPVERQQQQSPLNIKVMVNFAPQDAQSATLQPIDLNALISILRNIAREPRIGRFSIVAYNMQERRVLYRQEAASQIDFPALGHALNSLKLGTIDLRRLTQKHGETEFLSNLITHEVKEVKDPPDAVIFAGPKVMLDDSIPVETLKQLSDVKFPVFYMNYNLNPQSNPWRDAIGNTVRYLKGAEFTITKPRDLFFAWADIMGRIVKFKFGAMGAGNAGSQ